MSSSSSQLLDTEPGGEQTQYESVNTFNKPHAKQEGQLSGMDVQMVLAEQQAQQEKREQGERTAEKVRYGQTISEGGMSGFTTGQEGEAKQEAFGRGENQNNEQGVNQTRREQGYGPGSGIGG